MLYVPQYAEPTMSEYMYKLTFKLGQFLEQFKELTGDEIQAYEQYGVVVTLASDGSTLRAGQSGATGGV